MKDERLKNGGMQFITHYTERYSYLDAARMALEGGCRWVQLRMKDTPVETIEPVADARRILGAEYIIGGTANTFEDVLQHYKAGADYIGCGPFRYTTTKKNLSPILGLEGYTAIIHRMQEKDIHLPIVAIGGITIADIPAVMQTGVSGIALSGTVLHADSPADEMKRIISLMENEK